MRYFVTISVALVFSSVATTVFAQSDWTPLFNGENLDGWTQRGGDANYVVEDGEIVGSSVPNTPNSFLCTERNYADFELELEYKVHPELNSGIQFRSNSLADFKDGRVHGYQCEIDPSARGYSSGIYDEGRRGWLFSLENDVTARYAFKQNDWNHVRILAVGSKIQTWLNGVPATNLIDDMTAEGFIALQVHGVGGRQDPLWVRWRNIRIRENPEPEVDERDVKRMLALASAMDSEFFRSMARSERLPDLGTVPNQSLSLKLMSTNPEENADGGQPVDFSYEVMPVDASALAREINRGAVTTMVHANRIDQLAFQISGDRGRGWFSFSVPGLYRGRAEFTAAKEGGQWQVNSFRMPASGIHIVRNTGDIWADAFNGRVFDADAEITKLANGFSFTEGPAVGPDGRIYFNDIPNQRTHVFDPESGETDVFREETGSANGLFWTPNDELISCEGGNRQITARIAGEETVIATDFDGVNLNSPNDLALDAAGGLFFTDPRYGNRDDMDMEVEGVYYLGRKRDKVARVIDDMVRPNGLVFSPDFKTLYVADLGSNKTYAYDVPEPGKLENKRLFAEIGSDGMSIDQNGNVYFTTEGCVIVYTAEGEELDRLKFPEAPANCLLVGSTLYVTARTGFYCVQTLQEGIRQ